MSQAKDKPAIADDVLTAAVRAHWGVAVATLTFLPVGFDAAAGVYHAAAADGRAYFLKAKRNGVPGYALATAHALHTGGLRQVVAPLPTVGGELSTHADGFTLTLYPYLEGTDGMSAGLSLPQWTTFGALLRRVHEARLPDALLAQLPVETFAPHARAAATLRRLLAEPPTGERGPAAAELAAFWATRRDEIAALLAKAEALGRALQGRALPRVLCHTDIHTANVLLADDDTVHIVDWDQPALAPRERDLMFVMRAPIGGFVITAADEAAFFAGYGPVDVDADALAYYRTAWVVADMGAFAEEVFFMDGLSEAVRAQGARIFKQLFDPGNVVDVAYGKH